MSASDKHSESRHSHSERNQSHVETQPSPASKKSHSEPAHSNAETQPSLSASKHSHTHSEPKQSHPHSKSKRSVSVSATSLAKGPEEEPIDYDAIPTFPDGTTEADLSLPEELFLYKKQNAGFQIPYYMTSEAEISKVRPPAVVKTWEQRLAELDQKHVAGFHEFEAKVKAAAWYDEKRFDNWCCMRYYIARSHDVHKAYAMLEKTAAWLKETGAGTWTCESCEKDPNQHMSQFVGWDKEHRPILFMSMRWGPERKNPLRHMVAVFNHMIRMSPVGVEKWVVMTDFATYSHLRDSNPSMGVGVIRAIQDHYPERLGKMLIINPPGLFWGLWKLFQVVIDPVTRTKVEFIYTEDKPSIYDSFPKLFSPAVRGFLYDTYDRSKHDLPRRQLVWTPRRKGYATNFEERKQELRDNKEEEKREKAAEKEEAKLAKKDEKAAKKDERQATRDKKEVEKERKKRRE